MNSMFEIMEARHSVRSYKPDAIEPEKLTALREAIDECNKVPGLRFQMITDEPKAFDSFMAHYGKFSGVRNYVALIADKGSDEAVGYYGEKIVLLAQSLGLNTCWVGMTFSKKKSSCIVESGQKFFCAISFGYGTTQGTAHKSKTMDELCKVEGSMPEWFENGMRAAMLAPTALNQQKFTFILKDGKVTAESKGGPSSAIGLGIAKYHFELGSEKNGIFGL